MSEHMKASINYLQQLGREYNQEAKALLEDLFGKPAKPQTDKVSVDAGWYQTALKHYCGVCERWFKEARGAGAHQRLVHENVMKKNHE